MMKMFHWTLLCRPPTLPRLTYRTMERSSRRSQAARLSMPHAACLVPQDDNAIKAVQGGQPVRDCNDGYNIRIARCLGLATDQDQSPAAKLGCCVDASRHPKNVHPRIQDRSLKSLGRALDGVRAALVAAWLAPARSWSRPLPGRTD